jgi:hypothetical protein
MTERRGRWAPTTEQISLCVDLAAARMPLAKAAELIGIGPRTLWIFARRARLQGFGAWKAVSRGAVASRTGETVAPVQLGLPAQEGHF